MLRISLEETGHARCARVPIGGGRKKRRFGRGERQRGQAAPWAHGFFEEEPRAGSAALPRCT